MLVSRSTESRPAGRHIPKYSPSQHVSPSQMYSDAYTDPMLADAFAAGVRSVVKALNSGALSDEQAVDLVRVLATAYAGELISQRIGGYLESGFSRALGGQMEEWTAVGGR